MGRPTTTGKRHKVTVLIATYNHGGFIETAGENALEQSPVAGDVQIVVVDDGSTDDTSDYAPGYLEPDGGPGDMRALTGAPPPAAAAGPGPRRDDAPGPVRHP